MKRPPVSLKAFLKGAMCISSSSTLNFPLALVSTESTVRRPLPRMLITSPCLTLVDAEETGRQLTRRSDFDGSFALANAATLDRLSPRPALATASTRTEASTVCISFTLGGRMRRASTPCRSTATLTPFTSFTFEARASATSSPTIACAPRSPSTIISPM
eukprot:CAMPEP_0172625868 /NCGR_PEP_ID=MMETSP1068-20121228/146443_1 /TAXON_ID=35684 /ORGANISM="Pseudopedinella elastica, Strain CCMP716" /LENGTH=159 /DNA_ID=CAMNT_0013435299 /DNA_START=43 /DNA_END=521 /DNA_ORIENTATION=+